MKKIIVLISAILITGCASLKKKFEFRENIKFDSIYITKEKTILPPLKDTIYIDNPCDSVTGKIKPFKHTYTTPQGKITFETENGDIKASVDLDGVENNKEIISKVSKENTNYSLTESKTKGSWKIYLWLILSIALNIVFIVGWGKRKLG